MVVDRYLWTGLHGYNSLQKHPPRLGWLHLNRKYKNSLQNHQKHMRKHLSIELFAYYLPFFLLSLSLMFLLFHIFQIYSPPACCYQSFYLSISLPETQPKKKPLAIQQTASHSKPLYPSIPTFKTAYAVKPVSRGVAPLSESQLQKRQEYDVRHSILVPGSDALRPKLATKAALKCLQRAEGGEEKGKVVGKYGGFFDDI